MTKNNTDYGTAGSCDFLHNIIHSAVRQLRYKVGVQMLKISIKVQSLKISVNRYIQNPQNIKKAQCQESQVAHNSSYILVSSMTRDCHVITEHTK